MSAVGKFVGSITGANKAADAAQAGAQVSADAQKEALEYLKQTERIPQMLREGALTGIGGLFGLGDQNPSEASAAIKDSEIYKQIMATRGLGEDAILRNAAATGGLRSGNVSEALARYNTELGQQAFGQSLGVLQGLGQLPSNANQIAATTAGIGQTLGQGAVAAGQATQAGRGLALSSLVNFFKPSPGQSPSSFSDIGLKENIKFVGQKNGFNVYSWEWNKKANKFGLFGNSEGVLAQEVQKTNPEAVGKRSGYLTVDYSKLGL